MMDFSITPFKRVGDLIFGTIPDEVRSCVGSTFQSFKRSPLAAFPCDHFVHLGLFCYYDSVGKLEAVEMCSPANPTIGDVNILKLDFESATNALARRDDQLTREVDSAIAYGLGVSLYAPLAKETPRAKIESVLAFRSGYYN